MPKQTQNPSFYPSNLNPLSMTLSSENQPNNGPSAFQSSVFSENATISAN